MRFPSAPSISIILPTFNRSEHIVQAVQSVLKQSLTDWELIVVDDGSTDDTCFRLDPLVHREERVLYMKHSNRKAALSRNAGIQASVGRYITFLDSDDTYLPEHLESRFDYLERHQDIDLLSGGLCGEEDIFVKDFRNPEKLVHISQCIVCGTLFGRRHLFFELEGFSDLDYAEDTDLWNRARQQFNTKKIEAPKTYVYRRADDSITRNY